MGGESPVVAEALAAGPHHHQVRRRGAGVDTSVDGTVTPGRYQGATGRVIKSDEVGGGSDFAVRVRYR